MPNPWMDGLRHDPGRSANYNAGKNRMFMAVDHDTGGTNSYEICKWGRDGYNAGLCQILLPKVGVPWQFCEIDAICYHAGSAQYGDYNPFGPGYEVERLQGEPLSPDQELWLGRINAWAESEWGLPNVHYWGPQFAPWQANFHGSVNHRDIHPNPDGLSPAEWASLAPTPPAPPTTSEGEDMEILVGKVAKAGAVVGPDGLIPVAPGDTALLMQGSSIISTWGGQSVFGIPVAVKAWKEASPSRDHVKITAVDPGQIASAIFVHNKLVG